MPQYRLREGARPVNLGGGLYLEPGQHAELTAEQAAAIPGMEPVLEREPPRRTLERQAGLRNVDRGESQRAI